MTVCESQQMNLLVYILEKNVNNTNIFVNEHELYFKIYEYRIRLHFRRY